MAIIETEATLHEAHRDNHTHRDVNGGWLRPAVFGAMDGLVSNLALMTGVVGGAVSHQTVVITGLAGLAAGAFSMAAGEYTSVASQRELVEAELDVERRELRKHPEDEEGSSPPCMCPAVWSPRSPVRSRSSCPVTPSRPWRYMPGRSWASTPGSSLPARRRGLVLRGLRARRAPSRTAVPAGGGLAVARAAARAGRTVRVRCRGGPRDRAVLVVQRAASAHAGRCGGRCDVRPGHPVRDGRRIARRALMRWVA